jgi:hypothetical protein
VRFDPRFSITGAGRRLPEPMKLFPLFLAADWAR